VDLGQEYPIDAVAVYNRTDGNLGRRLNGFTLKVLDNAHRVVFERRRLHAPAASATYSIGGSSPEGTVRRAAMTALTFVRGKEADAFKALAPFARSGPDRQTAIRALLRIPTSYWPADEAQPLLDSVLACIRSLPAAQRTSAGALDALQLGYSLAGLLPANEARKVRKELGDLGVRVVRIGTLPEQMLYDKDRFVVQAGKPVEIVFENNDMMPHNLVITRPGALEEVGMQAEATGNQPDAMARDYVPVSGKVMLHSRLLPPRQAQKLDFTAPTQPGVYPYVCTFPGHWRRMYGAMYVVPDLDDYLADPQGYLTRHPVPIADELLKLNRPRKDWKYEELAPLVTSMENGRSFSNAKQIFQAATCVACHRLNEVGTDIGPDLSKLDPAKFKPTDILRDILEPSWRIEDKYATYIFALDSGKLVTGVVLEENADTVKVIENPLAKSKPLVLKKSDIAERRKSPTSIMPKGLLDRLNREEVLDLVAYIVARGHADSPLFQGSGHAHHH
ncbi:MAG TPA: plastocyanin/azurin family copper-binding protein, partial [Gemmataceae bacterium]|nr:plastocyanin/azurin family copper-binding protein [Gemmataceae bacterium]